MNFKRSILGVAVAGVAVVTPILMPISASAQTAAVFAFSGSASDTVDWVGPQSGTFTFGTSAPLGCSVDGVVSGSPVAGVGNCGVTSSGTFLNIVCSTGLAGGLATVTVFSGGSFTVGFVLIFVGGVGVLLPGGTPIPTSGPGPIPSAVGVFVVTPNSAQAPSLGGVCTFGFTVNASVEVFAP